MCKTCCHDRIVARRKQTVVCEGFGFGRILNGRLRRYRRGFDRIGINIYIFRRDGESYGIGFGLDVGNGERGAFSGRRGRRFVVFTTLESSQ